MAVADDFSRPSATAPAYDRQPPQDIPAEQSVLGGMLLSKDAIADVVEALAGPDFYRPAHQVIFEVMASRIVASATAGGRCARSRRRAARAPARSGAARRG